MQSSKTVFFTICARNYLAFAVVLGRSIREHHPDARFSVWLLDEGELPEIPDFIEIRRIGELLTPAELEHLGFYYEILELATAVKPRCFSRHFEEDVSSVIYIDPDIRLFRPLGEVLELLS